MSALLLPKDMGLTLYTLFYLTEIRNHFFAKEDQELFLFSQ